MLNCSLCGSNEDWHNKERSYQWRKVVFSTLNRPKQLNCAAEYIICPCCTRTFTEVIGMMVPDAKRAEAMKKLIMDWGKETNE